MYVCTRDVFNFYIVSRTPRTSQKKKILSKLRWSKKSSSRVSNKPLTHSQSWDSGVGASLASDEIEDNGFANEEDLPEPPPVPTVEYLLGKRPVNLRKRASDSLKQEIKQRAAALMASEEGDGDDTGGSMDDLYDSDGHSSVGSSKGDKKHRRKKEKQKRKKKRSSKEDDDFMWNYNKLSIPQSSPPRERKTLLGVERHPTPVPKQQSLLNGLPLPRRLDFSSAFDEVAKELEQAALWDSPESPSSLSPLNSPSPQSPMSPTSVSPLPSSPIHTATPTTTANHVHRPAPPPPSTTTDALKKSAQPKRAAPKLPPHMQNKQMIQNTNKNNNEKSTTGQTNKKASPISKILSSRSKSSQQKSQTKAAAPNQQTSSAITQPKSPSEFMAALTEAVSSSPKLPRFMRQDGTSDASPKAVSPTMDEIELQISEMQRTLSSTKESAPNRPPSPEPAKAESDSESSEYTSSSDETSTSESEDSSSGDSSDEEIAPRKPAGPRRPIMARNIGMSAGSKRGNSGFSRARLLARYPRLLRKKFIKLEPIFEVPEEMIYSAVSQSVCPLTH